MTVESSKSFLGMIIPLSSRSFFSFSRSFSEGSAIPNKADIIANVGQLHKRALYPNIVTQLTSALRSAEVTKLKIGTPSVSASVSICVISVIGMRLISLSSLCEWCVFLYNANKYLKHYQNIGRWGLHIVLD